MTNSSKRFSENATRDFVVEHERIPVTIGNVDHVLIELNGKQRDSYLTTLVNRAQISPDGKTTKVNNLNGIQSSLLAMSLYRIENGKEIPVDEKTILEWPSKTVKGLFEIASELSYIGDEEDEGDEGND